MVVNKTKIWIRRILVTVVYKQIIKVKRKRYTTIITLLIIFHVDKCCIMEIVLFKLRVAFDLKTKICDNLKILKKTSLHEFFSCINFKGFE